jgi:hypothetical protein
VVDGLLTDVREVFDLFDFWDGRDGLVDAAKIGDVMRCIGLNPTNKQILDNGGTKKFGRRLFIYRPSFSAGAIFEILLWSAKNNIVNRAKRNKSLNKKNQMYFFRYLVFFVTIS